MSNPFEDTMVEDTAPEVEDLDLDVDTASDDVEDTVEATDDKPEKAPKAPKEKKGPARPPVPEGKVTPVQFAKILTEHLEAKGASNKAGLITAASNPVPPQMVYSYIRNNSSGKNPLPVYSEGGRENLLIVEEALGWWDAKDERITASKAAKAEKASKKAEKASKDTESDATPDEGPVEEAE